MMGLTWYCSLNQKRKQNLLKAACVIYLFVCLFNSQEALLITACNHLHDTGPPYFCIWSKENTLSSEEDVWWSKYIMVNQSCQHWFIDWCWHDAMFECHLIKKKWDGFFLLFLRVVGKQEKKERSGWRFTCMHKHASTTVYFWGQKQLDINSVTSRTIPD